MALMSVTTEICENLEKVRENLEEMVQLNPHDAWFMLDVQQALPITTQLLRYSIALQYCTAKLTTHDIKLQPPSTQLQADAMFGQNTPHENAINLAVLGLAYFSLGEQTDDGKYRVRVISWNYDEVHIGDHREGIIGKWIEEYKTRLAHIHENYDNLAPTVHGPQMENAVDTIQGNLLQTVMSTNPNFGEFPEMMHRYLQIKDHVLEVANKLDHLVEIFQEANH